MLSPSPPKNHKQLRLIVLLFFKFGKILIAGTPQTLKKDWGRQGWSFLNMGCYTPFYVLGLHTWLYYTILFIYQENPFSNTCP